MKVIRRNREVLVTHPNDPSVKLRALKLTRAEAMAFYQEVEESRSVRVIKDGDVPLLDEKGNLKLYKGSDDEVPLGSVIKMLKRVYVQGSLQGVEDEDGKPITSVETILDEALDVVPADGEPYPFWIEVIKQISAVDVPNSQR